MIINPHFYKKNCQIPLWNVIQITEKQNITICHWNIRKLFHLTYVVRKFSYTLFKFFFSSPKDGKKSWWMTKSKQKESDPENKVQIDELLWSVFLWVSLGIIRFIMYHGNLISLFYFVKVIFKNVLLLASNLR